MPVPTPPYIGRGSWLGWSAAEGTYGTAATVVKFVPLVSSSLAYQIEREMIPEIKHDDAGFEQNTYSVRQIVKGTTEVVMRYDRLGYLLDAAIAQGTTSGTASPYTHTWTPTSGVDLTSLTVEVARGNSGVSEIFDGCKVRSWTMRVAAGEPMRLSIDWLGNSAAARNTPTSYSAPITTLYVQHHHAGTLSYNGQTYSLQSAELRCDNAMSELYELGSLNVSEPGVSNLRTVRLQVTISARNDLPYNANLAGTSSDAVLVFTHPTTGEVMTWTLKSCLVEPVDEPISNAGPITSSLVFRPRGSGATAPFSVVIQNTQANRYD